MKRTIKQWCAEQGINWLGQGSSGGITYDWKLVLGKGRTAIFSTIIEGELPEFRLIGKRNVLVFPNVNRPKNSGKISKAAFLRIVNWVEDCLAGNIRELKAFNQALGDIGADVGMRKETGKQSRSKRERHERQAGRYLYQAVQDGAPMKMQNTPRDKTSEVTTYPFVMRLIAGGYVDSLDDLLKCGEWVIVCDEGGQLIMFDKEGMDSQQILDKLERYAKELLVDGITNDEINGCRQKIW